jgi:hypothetical protein
VVLGQRAVRAHAGHARAAGHRRRGRGARPGRPRRQPRRAGAAAYPAALPGCPRGAVPAVGQLLHAALRRARVGLRALPTHRALRARDAARAAAACRPGGDDVRRAGGERRQQPRDGLGARGAGLSGRAPRGP